MNFNLTTEDLRLTDKAGGQSLYSGQQGLDVSTGFGRIVASQTEEPILLVNLVYSG